MAKEIAVLGIETTDKLLSSLLRIGYGYKNPLSQEISGYNTQEGITFRSDAEARHFLASGAGGIQL
jgi:hypothetical protein